MAEVHKMPWVNNLDVANETDYAAYLHGLANLIETKQAPGHGDRAHAPRQPVEPGAGWDVCA